MVMALQIRAGAEALGRASILAVLKSYGTLFSPAWGLVSFHLWSAH